MKGLLAAIAVLFAAGCGGLRPTEPTELLAECFADAAYACVAAEAARPTDDVARPCCGECNGTGKVLSGDRLALVDCDCEPSCKCKSGKSCGPGAECNDKSR